MVQLVDSDIKTREVLDWTGLHIFHYPASSCSQKTRIVLNLKGLEWESHIVNLRNKENNEEWFLGINPRGLVPVMVHDGAVHIESNDIIMYIDEHFPHPKLVPTNLERDTASLLRHEDELHLDLRSLTMRYLLPPGNVGKSPETLANYRRLGSGTVRGVPDPMKEVQFQFWHGINQHGGVTDEAVAIAAKRFRDALGELDETLEEQRFLLGDAITLVDIAWFVYVNRLSPIGYPLAELHPRVAAWFSGLMARPEFADEVAMPAAQRDDLKARQAAERRAGTHLRDVAGF